MCDTDRVGDGEGLGLKDGEPEELRVLLGVSLLDGVADGVVDREGVLLRVGLEDWDGDWGAGLYAPGARLLPGDSVYRMVGRVDGGPEESK